MKILLYSLSIMMLAMTACSGETEEETVESDSMPMTVTAFDEAKWKTYADGEYPYRDEMVEAVVYNDTIRSLNKTQIIDLLGDPDRENNEFLYYLISETKLFAWPLSTKYMVIKLQENDGVEWIKIHD